MGNFSRGLLSLVRTGDETGVAAVGLTGSKLVEQNCPVVGAGNKRSSAKVVH